MSGLIFFCRLGLIFADGPNTNQSSMCSAKTKKLYGDRELKTSHIVVDY